MDKKSLIELLENRKAGATVICFSALTVAASRKNPFGDIYKLSRVQGMTGFSYENAVNNLLEKEEKKRDFTAQGRSWGEKSSNNVLIIKGEKRYLRVRVLKSLHTFYMVRKDGFLKVVSKDTVKAYLKPSYKPLTQWKTDGEVIERDYKIEGILSLSIDGKRIKVEREK